MYYLGAFIITMDIPVEVCPLAIHSKVDATNSSNPFIFIDEDIV